MSGHRSLARSCVLGTFWGFGHTTALLVAGAAVIAFRLTISPELAKGLEGLVALVLVLLGGHVLFRSLSALTFHRHHHSHGNDSHGHVHLHVGSEERHVHGHLLRMGGRPFLVGLIHGMAGSGALMLLVLTTIPSSLEQLLYILVFGVGSTGGMLVLSGLIGIPFAVTARRSLRAHSTIQALAGGTSLVLGVVLAWNLAGA